MTVFQRFRTFFLGTSLLFGTATWSVGQMPTLIKDIRTGGDSWDGASAFYPVGKDKAFFYAKDDNNGNEPWVTDGTAAGTFALADLLNGGGSYSDSFSAASDPTTGKLYFTAYNNSVSKLGIFVSDGTVAGTKLFYQPDYLPYDLTFFNGKLYYTEKEFGLKTTDGTNAGTKSLIANDLKVHNMTQVQNKLYFAVENPDVFSGETNLYSISTANNTPFKEPFVKGSTSHHIYSIREGNAGLYICTGINQNSDVYLFTPSNSKSIKLLSNTGDAINNFEKFKGKDYFLLNNKFYESNGSIAGTKILKTFNNLNFYWSRRMFAKTDDYLFMNGETSAEGKDLWSYSPTAGVVSLDANVGAAHCNPYSLVSVGNKIYFIGTTVDNGTELMESNGTKSGTKVVADLNPGSSSGYPSSLHLIKLGAKNNLLFYATSPSQGQEPYRMEVQVISPIREQHSELLSDWVSIAPNPSSIQVSIRLESGVSTHDLAWQLSNIVGEIVEKGNLSSGTTLFQLPVSVFSNGIYFLRIQDKEGKTAVQRIVVQH